MAIITTTLTVDFSAASAAGSQGSVYAEVDTREGGLNGGRSSFRPGEEVVILIFLDRASLQSIASSDGFMSFHSTGSMAVDEYVTFAGGREASLSKPIGSGLAPS